jgi:catechol 2,3-dioxygenase-like lactoylglutathione lyase family enzyme
MVRFIDHVAVAVRDLDGAKRFFGLLGFAVADAVVIQGEQFSRYMGVPDLEADHVIMTLPGAAPRQQIHLVRFHRPEPLDDASRSRLDRIGINHFGFAVADLNATLAELEAEGVRRRAEMLEFPHRKLVFLQGPEGITVELSEWR